MLTLAALTLHTGPVAAEKTKVVIVPVGRGPSLVITARVARALMEKEQARGVSDALIHYPPAHHGAYSPSRALRRAERLAKKAKKHLLMLEFDQVRAKSHAALKIYKKEMRKGADSKGYVEALHMMAAADLYDGKQDEAFKWMNDAILFDRSAPSKKQFNPKVQSLHGEVLNRASHRGWVEFKIAPVGLVFFNRKFHGASVGRIGKRAGLYLLRIMLPGQKTWERWIRIRPGQTRELTINLTDGTSAEPAAVTALREDAKNDRPGSSTLLLASDHGAEELVLVDAGTPCTPTRCPITMRWSRGEKWIRKVKATYSGDPASVASSLLGLGVRITKKTRPKSTPKPADAHLPCVDDAQCFSNNRCVKGTCQRIVPITRKWWFWTLVGVGIAGVATAVAIPLATPAAPVIEVR